MPAVWAVGPVMPQAPRTDSPPTKPAQPAAKADSKPRAAKPWRERLKKRLDENVNTA
jgi:hypothetical protein